MEYNDTELIQQILDGDDDAFSPDGRFIVKD